MSAKQTAVHTFLRSPQPLLAPTTKLLESAENDALTDQNRAPLRIALLGYRSHPFVGGQGIYLKYLSRALAALGHSVDVLSGPPYPELDEGIGLIKIPSLNLYEAPNHVTALRPRHLLSYTDSYEWWTMLTGGFGEPYTFGRRVAKYLKHHQADYDIVHDNQCLAYGLLSIERLGLPVVATIHHPIARDKESALAEAPNRKHRWLIRRWYSFLRMQKDVAQKLEHVITVSEASRNDIHTYFDRAHSKTLLLPNGVDTQQFHPGNENSIDPWKIMTTASADQPIKGLNFLLEALALLKKDYPLLHLQVIGKLKSDSKSHALIQRLNLQHCVRFIDSISTQELVHQYHQSSIAVCPSLYEGFGLPVLEAMSCQVPVITTNGGALPEVAGDAGITVQPGSAPHLAQAIKTLLDDRALATTLARRGRERAETYFCWDRAAETLSHYYYSILP